LLNHNGNLIIKINNGNKIRIPFLKKTFSILVNLFDNYEIHNFNEILTFVIEFKNFNSNKFNNMKLTIKKILQEITKYENNEFTLDEAMNCLISNKFYYKISNNIIDKYKFEKTINKHILYDLNFNKFININEKCNKFISTYNNLIDKNLDMYQNMYNYIYNDTKQNIITQNNIIQNNIIDNTFCSKINKLFICKILLMLKLYLDNKLVDPIQFKNIYKTLLKQLKYDKSYITKIIKGLNQ
jgi:hypothetical protein